MVAIVSGNSLGLLNGSSALLGQNGLFGSPLNGQTGEGAYVNIATGNLVLQHGDDYVASRGLDLAITRTYNAQGKFTDDNGDNWKMGLSKQVTSLTGTVNTVGSTVKRVDGDGSESIYTYDAASQSYRCMSGAGAVDTLRFVSTTTTVKGVTTTTQLWTWTDGSTGMTEVYDAAQNGRIKSASDLNGDVTSYLYNTAGLLSQVTDGSNESVLLDYSGNNLSDVRVMLGSGTTATTVTRVQYQYDAQNRLTGVLTDLSPNDNSTVDGNTYLTSYTYDGNSDRVLVMSQSDGTKLTMTYVQVGADWRVQTVTDGDGRTTHWDYDTVHGNTTVTDALGYQTIYAYDGQGQLTSVTGPAINGGAQQTTYQYDGSGNVIGMTDALGNVTTMNYDTNGNQILQSDAAGNTVTRTFDSNNQLLTQTVYLSPNPAGGGAGQPQTTRYVYDGKNQLRFQISPEGRVTEFQYGPYGERLAAIQYTANTYNVGALAYNASPTVVQVAAWAAGATVDRTQTVRTDYTYDTRSLLAKAVTYGTVNAAGLGVVDGTQSTISYTQDQTGLLLKTTDANGGVTTYLYDGLGRLQSSTDAMNQTAAGKSTLISYDAAGNRILTTLTNGMLTTAVYDKAGQLTSVTQSDPNAVLLGQTTYSYDADGRLRMTVSPTGQHSYMLYDQAGRKTADIDAEGFVTEYIYNADNQVTHTIRYANAVDTTQLADATVNVLLDNVRPQVDPVHDRSTWNVYDRAGRLVKSVDALGYVTQVDYDGASEVARSTSYATAIDVSTLGDAPVAAAINPVASADDRITRMFYDNDGKLQGKLDAEGYLTEYRYNAGGELTDTIAYANVTDVTLRAGGNLAGLRPAPNAKDIHQVDLYNGKGLLAGTIDGEGYLTEFVYDHNGNVSSKVRYATPVVYTAGATLASLRPPVASEDHTTSYLYSKLNQLTKQTDPDGTVTQYVYDTVGNLTSKTTALGTTDARTIQQRFDLQGHLIAALTAEGVTKLAGTVTQADIDAVWNAYAVRYQVDAAGRRTSMTDQNGNRTVYFYDDLGRQVLSVNALGETERRSYDSNGDLTEITRYGARLSTTAAATLSGGLLDSVTSNLAGSLQNANIDSTQIFTYDLRGQLTVQQDAEGFVSTNSYDAFGDALTHTQQIDSSNTLQHAYRYDHRGELTQTQWDPNGLDTSSATQYDAFGRTIATTDANNNTINTSYDRLGRVVTIKAPLTAASMTTYDAFDRALTQTDGLGNTTRYVYNTQQRQMTITTPEGVTHSVQTNRYGQQYIVTDGNGNATTFTYDKNGNMLTATDALGRITTETYDRAGELLTSTDGNGKKVSYFYDADNRVLTMTVDPTGLNLTTTYVYDANTLTTTDPLGIVTQTVYDRKGQVTSVTLDPTELNAVTSFSYDGRGKTLQVTDANGNVTQYIYNALGQRTSEIVDPDGLSLETDYEYDGNGNVVVRTDANGHATRYIYDANNRLTYQLDPAGGVTHYVYDANDRLIQSTHYATAIAASDLDALPDVLQESDIAPLINADPAIDNTTNTIYDKDGRLAFTVDGNGAVIQRVYDGNGNVVRQVGYAHTIPLATPDTASAVRAAVAALADAAHDAVSMSAYDAGNRVTATVDGTGAVSTYKYDGNGNVLEHIGYAHTVTLGALSATAAPADVAAVVASAVAQVTVDAAHDEHQRMVYDTVNRMTAMATAQHVDSTGALQWSVVTQAYDQDGNIVSRTAFASFISSTTLAVGATQAQVSAWINKVVKNAALDNTTQMAYDTANRLVFSVNALGDVKQWVYDNVGNVVQTIAYGTTFTPTGTANTASAAMHAALIADPNYDQISCTVYDAANRAVFSIDSLGHLTQRLFDAVGNVIATQIYADNISVDPSEPGDLDSLRNLTTDIDVSNSRITFHVFDADNRLRYSIDGEGYVTQTDYDALGNVTQTVQYGQAFYPGQEQRFQVFYFADSIPVQEGMAAALPTPGENDRVNTFDYDAQGNLVHSTDPLQGQEYYAYDGMGRKTSFTNKMGAVWDYGYDAAGHLTLERDPAVDVTTGTVGTTVDPTGQTVSTFNVNAAASGSVRVETHIVYDAFGNVKTRTEAAGQPLDARATQYDYDAVGRQIRTTFPPVAVYDASHDSFATAGASVDVGLSVTTQALTATVTYDALGNAISSVDVGGNSSYKVYDKRGRVVYAIDAKGYVTGYTYDAFGNVTDLTRYAVPLTTAAVAGSALALERTQVTQLYTILLGRVPDSGGLAGWVDGLDRGQSFVDIAQGFFNSPETAKLYPASPPLPPATASAAVLAKYAAWPSVIVNQFFKQALGRLPDMTNTAEAAIYNNAVAALTANRQNQAQVVVDFINNLLIGANAATTTLNNKVAANLALVTLTKFTFAGVGTALGAVDHSMDREIITQYDMLDRAVIVTEPLSYVNVAGQIEDVSDHTTGYEMLRKVTYTNYNAFGDIFEQVVVSKDHIGNDVGSDSSDIHFYYNHRGEKVAQIERVSNFDQSGNPNGGFGNEGGYGDSYLTEMSYDAAGNLTDQIEYANLYDSNNLNDTSYEQFGDLNSTDDRHTQWQYDLNNNKISETRLNVETSTLDTSDPQVIVDSQGTDLTTTYGYDAVGNLTRTTDALGDSTYSYHDALGRVTAVASVGVDTPAAPGISTLSVFNLDVYGNVVLRTDFANGVVSADDTAYVAGQASANDRATATVFDKHGNAIETVDADHNASFASYDAFGHVAKQWRTVTSSDGSKAIDFSVMRYDAVGQLIETDTPGAPVLLAPDTSTTTSPTGQPGDPREITPSSPVAAGLAKQENTYDAFGELVGKSLNGKQYEYENYDSSGHLWRTNAGDGIDKVMLYDVAGDVTAEIRSTVDDLKTLTSASQALSLDGSLRTDTQYDLMGHALTQTRPSQATSSTPVTSSVEAGFINFAVEGRSGIITVDGSADPTSHLFDEQLQGSNTVRVNWMSLAGWGSGDVKVQIDYASNPNPDAAPLHAGDTVNRVDIPPQSSKSMIFSADQAQDGVNLNWTGAPADNVTRVQMWKKDITGQWVLLADSTASGGAGNFVRINASPDVSAAVKLSYNLIGQENVGGAAPQEAALTNFGDMLVFNSSNLSGGHYSYSISYADAGQDIQIGGGFISASPITTQITQLYVLLLNRAPDHDGLAFYAAQMVAGVSLADIAQSIMNSTEAQGLYPASMSSVDLINSIFQNAFGTSTLQNPLGQPDPSQASYWASVLDATPAAQKGQFFVNLLNIIETFATGSSPALFDNKVTVGAAYAVNLDGNDLATEQSLMGLVTTTDTSTAMVAAINSTGDEALAQMRQKVAQLYLMLFDRAPDSDGINFWVSAMQGGMSIVDIAQTMWESKEAQTRFQFGKTPSDIVFALSYGALGVYPWDSNSVWGNVWLSKFSTEPTGQAIVDMINAAEGGVSGFGTSQAIVKQALDDKVAVGLTYSLALAGTDIFTDAPNLMSLVLPGDTADAINIAAAAVARSNVAHIPTEVAQLYILLLNRAPEPAGLNFWAAHLGGGMTFADIAQNIWNSDEATKMYPASMSSAAIITQIYRNALGRDPSAAELANWAGQLDATPRGQQGAVFASLIKATEVYLGDSNDTAAIASQQAFNNRVADGLIYTAMKNIPSASGVTQTMTSPTSNVAATAIAAMIPTDAIIAVQVTRMYVLLFNRAPDHDGLTYWTAAVKKGESLANLAYEMFNSVEGQKIYAGLDNRDIVISIYTHALGRTFAQIDPVGLDFWTNGLDNAQLQGPSQFGSVFEGIIDSATTYAGDIVAGQMSRDLLNNKVTVGLGYAAVLQGNDAQVESNLMALTTATDTSVALTAAANAVNPIKVFAPVSVSFEAQPEDESATATVTQTVDRWGNVVDTTDARNANWHTQTTYNANNQVIQQVKPNDIGEINVSGGSTIRAFFVIQHGDNGGPSPTTNNYYDALGRLIGTSDANSNVNALQYDVNGNVIEELHADTGIVHYDVNAVGERTGVTDADGHHTTYAYDQMGNLMSTSTDPVATNGQSGLASLVTTYKYDELGRRIKSTDNASETTTTQYDLAGNVIRTQDGNSDITRFAYDAFHHQIAEVDANGNSMAWNVNAFGQLQDHTDLSGVKTTYAYDKAGELTGQTAGTHNEGSADGLGQNLSYTYSGGLLTTIVDNVSGQTTTYNYDKDGNRISEKSTVKVAAAQPINVNTSDTGVYSWTAPALANTLQSFQYRAAGSSGAWQTVSVPNGASSVNLSGLAAGTYDYALSWSTGAAPYAQSTGQLTVSATAFVPASLKVGTAGLLNIPGVTTTNPHTLQFTALAVSGGATTSANLYYRLAGTTTWSTKPAALVALPPWGGAASGQPPVQPGTVDLSGLPPGTYEYELVYSASNASSKGKAVPAQYATGELAITSTSTMIVQLGKYGITTNVNASSTMVVQDNHLSYDTLGRLISVNDSRTHMAYTYDANGNRINVVTSYIDTNGQAVNVDDWNAYDTMNRATVIDGVQAANGDAVISKDQGHEITYDAVGNRLSDTWYDMQITATGDTHTVSTTGGAAGQNDGGTQQSVTTYTYALAPGNTTEAYTYDAANRLVDTSRDSVLINTDTYDAASRLATSTAQALPALSLLGIAAQNTITHYNAAGRLADQTITDMGGNVTHISNGYDNVGNLITTRMTEAAANLDSTYAYAYKGYDIYKVQTESLTHAGQTDSKGVTTRDYDGNGNVVDTVITTVWKDPNTYSGPSRRTIINDANGQVLWKNDDGAVTHTLIVNGQVLGDSSAVSVKNPADGFSDMYDATGTGAITFAATTYTVQAGDTLKSIAKGVWGDDTLGALIALNNNLDAGTVNTVLPLGLVLSLPAIHAPVVPAQTSSSYTVHAGDTLQSIASTVWGDAGLWYTIADANGISGNAPLTAGQILTLPPRSNVIHDGYQNYVPYNQTNAIGDTTPTLAVPPPPVAKDGCGVVGAVVTIIVAVILTIYAPEGSDVWWKVATAAISSAVGQEAAIAVGEQDKFSWSAVALAAVSAGVTEGIDSVITTGPLSGTEPLAIAGRAAIANALTQGIAVATGLQDHFDWRGVVASAAGAAVGSVVGGQLSGSSSFMDTFGTFGVRAVSSFAAGATTAVLRGGKISTVQIALDAFGNALAGSVTAQNNGPQVGATGNPYVDSNGDQIVFGPPVQSGVSDAAVSQIAAGSSGGQGLGYVPFIPNFRSSMNGMQLAANDVRDPLQQVTMSDAGGGMSSSTHDAEMARLNAQAWEPTYTPSGQLLVQVNGVASSGESTGNQSDPNGSSNNLTLNASSVDPASGAITWDTGAVSYPVAQPTSTLSQLSDASGSSQAPTEPLSFVDRMQLWSGALHVNEGFVNRSFDQAVRSYSDPNESYVNRGINFVGATLMLPAALGEEATRGLLNIPSGVFGAFPLAAQGGNATGIAFDSSLPTETRTIGVLSAFEYYSGAIVGLGGPAAMAEPGLADALPPQFSTPVGEAINFAPSNGRLGPSNQTGSVNLGGSSGANTPKTFPNLMAEDLQKDLALAKSLNVSPVKVSDPEFAKIAEQGTVKWAVLQNGDLVAVPKNVLGQEIKHSVLSNGEPVLAAGEATVDVYGNLKYGAEINRYSGHFQPPASSLQIGVDAFKNAGISFKTVNPTLPPEFYWGF